MPYIVDAWLERAHPVINLRDPQTGKTAHQFNEQQITQIMELMGWSWDDLLENRQTLSSVGSVLKI